MSTKAKGFAVVFERTQAEQVVMSQSGQLSVVFGSWTATPEGLVRMFDGVWRSTGKPVGTKCLILNGAVQGRVDMAWSHTPQTSQKMQLVAGYARFAKAK